MTPEQVKYFAAIRPAITLPEPFALGPGEWVACPATFIGVNVARLDVPAARLREIAAKNLETLTFKINK